VTRTAINAWRTVATVLAALLVVLLAFVIQGGRGWTESSANAFASLAMWCAALATGQAFKGTVEAIAQGGGTAAIRAVLTTDAKPGDPIPAAPTPPPTTEP
jgi:hypothetical protein